MNQGQGLGTILKSYTFIAILVLSLVCLGLALGRNFHSHHHKYPFLLFNLLLSWIPLLISLSSVLTLNVKSKNIRKVLLTIQGILWLLLYPNDSYLVTDFVHVFANPRYDSMPFNNMYLWYDLVLFFLYSLCGLLLGYQSLRYIHEIIRRKFSKVFCWSFIVVISYVVAFGVYLGRMGRVNSWDAVMNIKSIAKPIFEDFSMSSVQFIGLFGSFLVFVYLLFYLLIGRTMKTPIPSSREITR
jgi:uncharacterized membrane protein